ncbi:hypothetical protein BN2476_260076 [Paraburkholderia piptadeniae]|uniref:Uncharacterized protein n=1 Tax=Paraburkholderia piptadeniae TaxID=1701573 RepID=A0A1N7S185_9BURK|nr:hypothetical protein BN2476_260076 [Paraburkholderia piptadeniae]
MIRKETTKEIESIHFQNMHARHALFSSRFKPDTLSRASSHWRGGTMHLRIQPSEERGMSSVRCDADESDVCEKTRAR